ncbi:DUF6211 family protein [Streptomyces paludis]|uniref:Uncharacterized protein n=1 Tax=Streptomyces paludis TaxID=2282738 RepID=A0A345HQR3_9ACTN|nr:DUF6211 family protein [Streptomyces paludis]AXG79037.1 hypothetical protein DVK44_16565 [Streptomyces paludis]
MLCDHHPDAPRPGDLARLRPGNSIGADTFVIVEDFPPSGASGPNGGHVVLNRPDGRRGHEDWAAAVTVDQISALTRIEPDGSRTWGPAPHPEDIR